MSQPLTQKKKIALVGNALPRKCGIATFTTHLRDAVAQAEPGCDAFIVAMNDRPGGYRYDETVRFTIDEGDALAYRRAADFLNVLGVDAVCLQHEYGIFGGEAGSHILHLLRSVHMPVVTTLHTVLREPSDKQLETLRRVAELSDRLVVMSEKAVGFLRDVYGVEPEKVDLIPHGAPDVPFVDPNFYKDRFGVEGKKVLLTFGLLSPGKGIEHVIEALPGIVKSHPEVVYIVLGATHPHVRKQLGETYRLSLQSLAERLGVAEHVLFYDQFVEQEELVEFIAAADIYVTPYLNEEQITSGTLAYCVAAGKAIVSTPYWHAQELLAEGRGRLVPFRDPGAIAREVNDLLTNEIARHAMRKKAYLYGRGMIWPAVGGRYHEAFDRALAERVSAPRTAQLRRAKPGPPTPRRSYPLLKLDHLRRLTDDVGVIEHAVYSTPRRVDGYSLDDNARALLLCAKLCELGSAWRDDAAELGTRYMAYIVHAYNEERGRFRHGMRYDRSWEEEVGSEDCHGRAIWALGVTARSGWSQDVRDLALELLWKAAPAADRFTYPRAWAFAALGLAAHERTAPGDARVASALDRLAERLARRLRATRSDDWVWFEDILAYDNARLPQALIDAGTALGREEYTTLGLEALAWLTEAQTDPESGHFVPIGTDGWWRRGQRRARFDQQPVEACATIGACAAALRATGEERWRSCAQAALDWFLGRNDLGERLYDPATGACCDGLHPASVNRNQGAESTLAYLLSLVDIRLLDSELGEAEQRPEEGAVVAQA